MSPGRERALRVTSVSGVGQEDRRGIHPGIRWVSVGGLQ